MLWPASMCGKGRRRMKHERSERALQPEEQGIRQSQPGLQWGSHPLLMPADICEPPTNYEPRVKCTVTCSAEPDSRGNVLSCRLRIWAHTQKCWKLADEDSQQIRKQATAALWTLSFSSYIPISHLLQHCQDSPSPALNLILSSSIFFVVVVAVVIFFLFLFKGKKKKQNIEFTCWLRTISLNSWLLHLILWASAHLA